MPKIFIGLNNKSEIILSAYETRTLERSSLKIFPYQVGFTAPPHDFDAAPHDLKIAPEGVAHGRLIHVENYAHQLSQRVDNFHKLEEVVHCVSNAGADVVGQVGTNWSHAGGKTPADIRSFCDRMEIPIRCPCTWQACLLLRRQKIWVPNLLH